MKRLIAILMMLMMLTASASAAEWAEGLSPEYPSTELPEPFDFSKTIGLTVRHPNWKDGAPAGGKVLRVYLPRMDVEAGTGSLILRSASKGEEWRAAFNDTEYVIRRELTEEELDGLLWGEGIVFEITLPVSLRLGETYYVDLEERCLIDRARGMANPKTNGEISWYFETTDDYGVSEVQYRSLVDDDYEVNMGTNVKAGEELKFDLLIGGEAKSALVMSEFVARGEGEAAEAMISFEQFLFTESCEVVGEVLVDNPAWYVYFYSTEVPEGEPIANIEF